MRFKKIFLLVCLLVCLFAMASVCASDANGTVMASEDTGLELSADNEMEDNLQTNEENPALAVGDNDETVSAQTDSEILTDGQYNYTYLREQIGSGGNKSLAKGTYTYNQNDGYTISITESGVIDGNGAIIDMAGFNKLAFEVFASDVTIQNLTIKNANYNGGNGGAIWFSSSGTVINCNFTGNNGTASNSFGGTIFFAGKGTVTNCNFIDNIAYRGGGGVIFFNAVGTVTNCNFIGNNANHKGGAIYSVGKAEVTNCNFTNNTSDTDAGAVFFHGGGDVINCNFIGNKAKWRCGAVYFDGNSYGSVENCNFTNNSAKYENKGGAIFSGTVFAVTADTCIFKTDSDTTYQTHILPPTLNVDNFTTVYGSGEKLTLDLRTNSGMPVNNRNISISVYFKNNDSWVCNYSFLSGEGWAVDLPLGSYYAIFDTEYVGFQPINRTIEINKPYVNVTLQTTTNRTVNITAKSNIPNEVIKGKLVFVLPNSAEINATYEGNGIWWAVHTFDDYTTYQVNATYTGLDNVTINNATITINKAKTELTADAIVAFYNINKDLVIILKDNRGNPIGGVSVAVDLNRVKNYTTDGNGQVKIPTKGLAVGTYEVSITFNGADDYVNSSKTTTVTILKEAVKISAKPLTTKYNVHKYLVIALKDNKGNPIRNVDATITINGVAYKCRSDAKGDVRLIIRLKPKTYTVKITFDNSNYVRITQYVKVTVLKATPKLIAKKKTFKVTKKVKKYTVTLKDNKGKAIKKAKVTLKIGKKTYKVKTNSKGKAVFKIKNLNKKGKYKAVIKYNGNYLYKMVTKKVKLVIK